MKKPQIENTSPSPPKKTTFKKDQITTTLSGYKQKLKVLFLEVGRTS